ncbi:MFS transporter [Sinosporangium siamense]|uniref:Multidrug resistance protein n=1 Tax=Sinosporangium siamense TaxID=1367973 RepID=A0A919REC9_9ACTN|nr:MFS transporter [Sinosporangium siamense]GII92323.1 multidrug resistance protein [Sinosporangium siamense]
MPLLLATFTATLASNIVNVPMPLLIGDLDVSLAAGSLVITAFTLPFAVLLPIAGWLGDRVGHRRLFCLALLVLGAGSAAAAAAPALPLLVACRVVQGVATAAILPTVMALISEGADGPRRGRALAAWAAANGLGQAASPALGGVLAAWFGWRAVFWPVALLSLAGLVLAFALLPKSRPRAIPLEWAGATLLTLTSFLALGTMSAAAAVGTRSPAVWAGAFLAVLTLVVFVVVERRHAEPFLPPRLVVESRYLRSCLAVSAQMFCLGATLLAMPLYLIGEHGVSAQATGAMMLGVPLAMVVLAPVAGVTLERAGARFALRLGLVILIAGQVLSAVVLSTAEPHLPLLMGALVTVGAGIAFVQTPAAIGATRSRAGRLGAGLGLFNLTRFGGAVLGTAWAAGVIDRAPAFGLVFLAGAAVAVAGLLGSFAGPDPAADGEQTV